jgi:hypothetical protein
MGFTGLIELRKCGNNNSNDNDNDNNPDALLAGLVIYRG